MKRAGELWGGFTAMLVVLPSSMAYGVTAYAVLGPEYSAHGVRAGIIGAIALGLIATALGGAPRVISAPCAPAGAVLAALIGGMLGSASGDVAPEQILARIAVVAMLAGILQLLLGAAGGGRLIKYIPYPVVAGYMTAVGVLIFLSQLPKFSGAGGGVDASAVVVGSLSAAAMLVSQKLTQAVPSAMVGLGAGVAAYFALGLVRPELLELSGNAFVIGPIGGAGLWSGIPDQWAALGALKLTDLSALVMPAVTLSVLLSVDTLKTCVVVDSLTRARHNADRTLVGQGAGNVAAALLGGMPGAGTMGATLVSIESGGRTRAAGILEGTFVLAAALVLGSWIAWVPLAALAGILMVVAARMCDWGCVHLLRQRSTVLDFVVIATVVVVAVASDLIVAAAAGVALSVFLFVREQVRGSVVRRKISGGQMTSKQHRSAAQYAALERYGAQITVCELQGSLFFGTTDQLYSELESDLKQCRYLILDLRRVQSLDYTAAHLFGQFEAMLAERGGYLLFSRLPARRELREYFAQVGMVSPGHNARKFDTLDDALEWAEDRVLAEVLPQSEGGGEGAPLELAAFDLVKSVTADESLAALKSCVVERSYVRGAVIFRSGDRGDELFLIRRGVVRIALQFGEDDYHTLASFGRGDFLGEMAFLDSGTRSASAIATAPTEAFVLSRARLDAVVGTHPQLGLQLYAQLARAIALRLRRADSELRALYDA